MFNPYMPIAQSVKLANDEAKRQLLIDKANYEASLISSQTILGPDMLPYITPFADKLITNDTHKTLSDDRNVKIQMETLLNNVCDKEIADYILNKLTIDEMKILIPNWNELLMKLKKTTKKFTKDTFYNWIMLYIKDYTNTVSVTGTLPSSTTITPSIPESKPPSIPHTAPSIPVKDFKTELAQMLLKRKIASSVIAPSTTIPLTPIPSIPLTPVKTPVKTPIVSINPSNKDLLLELSRNLKARNPIPIAMSNPPITQHSPIIPLNIPPKIDFMTELSKLILNKPQSTDLPDALKAIDNKQIQPKNSNLLNEILAEQLKKKDNLTAEEKEQIRLNEEEKRRKIEEIKQKRKEQEQKNASIPKHIIAIERDEIAKMNKLKSDEFALYVKNNYNITIPKPKRGSGSTLELRKKEFYDNDLRKGLMEQYPAINTPLPSSIPIDTGKGIKITLRKPMAKRVITGKGLILEKPPIVRYLQINDVHKIDLQRLNQEIPLLHVLYINQTSKPLSKLANVRISKDTVDVIKNMIDNKFNQKEYSLLPLEMRRIIQQFNSQCKFNLNIPDEDNNKAINDFNIMYGEFKSGNNNKDLLIKLKKQVILFMNEKLITQKDGQSILLQIALS